MSRVGVLGELGIDMGKLSYMREGLRGLDERRVEARERAEAGARLRRHSLGGMFDLNSPASSQDYIPGGL